MQLVTFTQMLYDINFQIMTKKLESEERIVKGNKLECPICNNNKFWARETLMNTPGMTFFARV